MSRSPVHARFQGAPAALVRQGVSERSPDLGPERQPTAAAQYDNDIMIVARQVESLGARFEFEAEKIEALKIWRTALPNNPDALNGLAWRLAIVRDESLRNLSEAEQFIRRAIEIQNDLPFFHNTLGAILFHQDRLEEAELSLNRSLELKTTEPSSDWYFLSRVRSRQGKTEEARSFYEQANAWMRSRRPKDVEQVLFDELALAELKKAELP